jgi:hypothetical protein
MLRMICIIGSSMLLSVAAAGCTASTEPGTSEEHTATTSSELNSLCGGRGPTLGAWAADDTDDSFSGICWDNGHNIDVWITLDQTGQQLGSDVVVVAQDGVYLAGAITGTIATPCPPFLNMAATMHAVDITSWAVRKDVGFTLPGCHF